MRAGVETALSYFALRFPPPACRRRWLMPRVLILVLLLAPPLPAALAPLPAGVTPLKDLPGSGTLIGNAMSGQRLRTLNAPQRAVVAVGAAVGLDLVVRRAELAKGFY